VPNELPIAWIAFAWIVITMLALDLFVFHRKAHEPSPRESLIWAGVWIGLAALFNLGVYVFSGSEKGLEWTAGYLIEESLSVDNIFVFLLCFRAFRVPLPLQHRVLFWGVLGALAMRLVMIFAGISLLERFHWLHHAFGLFLAWSGYRLLTAPASPSEPSETAVVRWTRRIFPVTEDYRGERFWVREQGVLKLTPLLLVLLCVEATDLMFAFDSIPAILAITQDPFLVFTSNALALLGMRALYFAVQGLLERLRYLHHGLAAILVFVGAKLLLTDHWHPSSGVSLLVILTILAIAVGASLMNPGEVVANEWSGSEDPEPEA